MTNYITNSTNFSNIFDTSGNSDNAATTTNFKINGTDLGSTYTLLGKYSNLKLGYNTNYLNNGTDLKDIFQFKLFDYANTTAAYITLPVVSNLSYSSGNPGILIIITSSGDIRFTRGMNNLYMYITAGGGAGGSCQNNSNAGGGGGAGGGAYGKVDVTNITKITATIGNGGTASEGGGTSGGNSTATFYNSGGTNLASVTVYGGGSGGNGELAGTLGGSSGGNGSFSGTAPYANDDGITATYSTNGFSGFTEGSTGGGGGQNNSNNRGAGGGGGGFTSSGTFGGGGVAGIGGDGISFTFTTGFLSGTPANKNTVINISGGGGGGSDSGSVGGVGKNGGGAGGSANAADEAGKRGRNALNGLLTGSTSYYYGGGGGGAANWTDGTTGGNGAKGAVILYIDSTMYT